MTKDEIFAEAKKWATNAELSWDAEYDAECGFIAGVMFVQQLLQQKQCTLELLQMLNEVEKAYPNISEPYVTSKEVDKYVISNVIRLIKERQPIA